MMRARFAGEAQVPLFSLSAPEFVEGSRHRRGPRPRPLHGRTKASAPEIGSSRARREFGAGERPQFCRTSAAVTTERERP